MSEEEPSASPSLGRRAAYGAVWITVEMALVQATSLVVFTVMARFLTPRDFGLVSLSYVLLSTVKIVFLDQICTAVVRKANAADLEYSTAFWLTIIAGLVALTGLNAASLVTDRIFGAPGLGNIVRAMSVILLAIAATRTQEQWLSRNFRFKVLATRSIVGAAIGGATGVACALSHFGVWSLVVQQLVTSAASMTLLWSTCPWRPTMVFSRQVSREIFAYLRSVTGGSIIYVINQNCDVVMVGLFFGPASVGIYSVGKRLTVALHMVAAAPINGVAMPSLAEVQQDSARLRRVLLTAMRVVLSLCAPVFVGVASIDHDVIRLVFGAKWLGAVPVFGWLSIGALFMVVLEYNNNIFVVKNRPAWTMYLAFLYSALALAAFFLLSGSGSRFLALPFVLPYLIILPMSVVLVGRLADLPISKWFRAVAPPLISAGIMFLAVRLTIANLGLSDLAPRLACGILTGALTYAAGLALFSPEIFPAATAMLRARRVVVGADT